jgi:hypothetical protein
MRSSFWNIVYPSVLHVHTSCCISLSYFTLRSWLVLASSVHSSTHSASPSSAVHIMFWPKFICLWNLICYWDVLWISVCTSYNCYYFPSTIASIFTSLLLLLLLLWPPLWSSGQSSWLQSLRSGFDSRGYQIFWEVVGLERGPLGLMSTTEELLGRKSSSSSLENRDYGRGDPQHWPCDTTLSAKSWHWLHRQVAVVQSR